MPLLSSPLTRQVLRAWRDNRYFDSIGKETFQCLAPATEELLCAVQQSSKEDVDRTVSSAQEGFKAWRRTTGAERGRVLKSAAAILRENVRTIAVDEVRDTGKPLQEALAVDVFSAADCLEYFGGAAATITGSSFDLGPKALAYTRREPLGVCAAIGAWNYPLQIACWKSAPALAAGNSVVYKPSEMTPVTACYLAEALALAGLPEGVFNIVQGDERVGRQLCEHPDIAKVSLTGEVGTGVKVMASAATTLKKVTLELGGKSPLIVFPSASMKNAVSGALMANFYTQGEICSNGTRVFVHESIHDAFVAQLRERTMALKVGDPLDEATQIGSLISRAHMQRVLEYIQIGVSEGARLVCGGTPVTVPGTCSKGAFVAPAIFTDCTDNMRIVREEIFGPVMTVLKFKDEDEVIMRANDTKFGLAAGIFTQDLAQAHRVSAELQAGICWVNNYNITPIEIPFGGYKMSGIGRENSMAAFEHFTQLKTVYVEMGDVESTL